MTTSDPGSTLSLKARVLRIAPYFRGSRWSIALAGIASLIAAGTEPLLPALMQPLLDSGFHKATFPLWLVPVVVIALFAVRGVAGFVAEYALSWSAQRGTAELRRVMFNTLLTGRAGLFTRHSASSLTNTLVYEVQIGAMFLVNSVLSLLKDSLTLVALLSYLLWLNWKLTIFVAVLIPAIAFVTRVMSQRLNRLGVMGQSATDELAYVVEENVLGWRIVRLHDAAGSQAARFHTTSEKLRRLSMKSVTSAAAMSPLTQVMTAIAVSAVLVAALYQSSTEGNTVGNFVAFITAMLMLLAPIKHLADIAGPLTRGLVSFERGVLLINEGATERGGSFQVARASGRAEFSGVGMRYRDDQTAALAGVDLVLQAGESVALVGPSGSGKSTLVNLLLRFFDPTAGRITLEGHALEDWDIQALRRQFALVSQDVVLLKDSVAANVSLGSVPDRARVTEALRSANLLDFVNGLPQGMDSPIGHNGSELSGGQRQRLAIARAIYKDAPILILDEATSALDSESERLVQDALERLMRGRTSIVIAHRLSTIERADRIIALDGGRVVEQGSHAELLAHGGLYARLHALQFRS